jgi:GT2 family glycosyltransferase
MTARCLNSVVDSTDDEPREVIIVDDGSPIQAEFKDSTDLVQNFRTIRRELNGGYCAAVNMGMFYAKGDVLILGNNDLTFEEGWLEGLLSVLDKGYDLATCWTSDQDNIVLEDKIEDDARFGSLFAMKREVYETVGPFDEQFRGYFGDTDYRKRVMDNGFKIGKNLNLVVKHKAKATYIHTDPDDFEFRKAARLYEIKWGFSE